MRSLTFTLGDVVVTITEDNGQIFFDLDAQHQQTAIKGLFFNVADSSVLNNLLIDASDSTHSVIADNGVTSLPRGIGMQGTGAQPFDVGIAFGTAAAPVNSTGFRLYSDTAQLTLDDFANVQFGINAPGFGAPRQVITLTAAPDAVNDTFDVNEDGATTLNVLGNDTDADLNPLSVISATNGGHGTVTVAADGSVVYTPNDNYSGPDSFSYTISDGHGGQDTANVTVNVLPVADAPTLNVVLEAGNAVNEIRVHVTTAVTDDSEFIDRLEFFNLPEGAQILEATANASGGFTSLIGLEGPIDQYFTLVLPTGTDHNFDLVVQSWSAEPPIPPEEFSFVMTSTTQSVSVLYEANTASSDATFSALDQNIWGTGSAATFAFDEFIGLDLTGENALTFNGSWDPNPEAENPLFYVNASAEIKAGVDVDIALNAGEIDATVPMTIIFGIDYNRTTDMMAITPSFLIAEGAGFDVIGPGGHAIVDLILQADAQAALGVDIGLIGFETPFGPVGFDPEPTDILSYTLPSQNYNQNLVDLDSDNLTLSHEFGLGFTGTLTWPVLDATGTQSDPTTISSTVSSEDVLAVNLDVDDLIADVLLGGINPLDEIEEDFDIPILGTGTIEATLIDLDLGAGANVIQNLAVAMSGMTGLLTFEDNTTLQFSFADGPITIADASQHDIDGDDLVEFSVQLTPISTLDNTTNLGVNLNGSLEIAHATVTANDDTLLALGLDLAGAVVGDDLNPVEFGPLVDVEGEVQVATITVFDSTFALNFGSQSVDVFDYA